MRENSRFLTPTAALLFAGLICTQAIAADRLFAVSGSGSSPSRLYELDPTTGALITDIGSTGRTHVVGLDFDPSTGILYAHDNDRQELVTLDISTGASTLVGVTSHQIPDLTFRADGQLFAWSEFGPGASDDLIMVNKSSGASSVIPVSLSTAETGLAFNSTGTLFLRNFDDTLKTINPGSGAVLSSINLSASSRNILDFDSSDVCFTGERSGGTFILQRIDTGSGVVTTVGSASISGIAAIAFMPAGGGPGGGGEVPASGTTSIVITLIAFLAVFVVVGRYAR